MKKLLLIVGILVLLACVLILLLAALKLNAYHTLRDATPEHYQSLLSASTRYLIVGVILAALGAACLILRVKL